MVQKSSSSDVWEAGRHVTSDHRATEFNYTDEKTRNRLALCSLHWIPFQLTRFSSCFFICFSLMHILTNQHVLLGCFRYVSTWLQCMLGLHSLFNQFSFIRTDRRPILWSWFWILPVLVRHANILWSSSFPFSFGAEHFVFTITR